MNNSTSDTITIYRDIFDRGARESRIALLYHLQIRDTIAYNTWYNKSSALLETVTGSRLFCMSVDPVPREGLYVDEIIIDEYPSAVLALQFVSAILKDLTDNSDVTIIAIQPESHIKFRFIHTIARLKHFFRGINDFGTPTTGWKADNIAVWPDEQQMAVARAQELDRPLLVYNLNKNRIMAQYQDSGANSEPCSGEEAYERYSKIAGEQLLRRGAYPVYGGKPLGILAGSNDNMLFDTWSKFILVHYPQRRNLLAMIESEEFRSGQCHRDAGLERVAIFMGSDKMSDPAE